MVTKLSLHMVVPCILVLYLLIQLDTMHFSRSKILYLNTRTRATTAHGFSMKSTEANLAPRLGVGTPLKVDVVSFTRIDPLPGLIPTCEGCSAITVVFSVTCTRLEGCEDLSVMDTSVTYESTYPTLFYGDEFPNPLFQDIDYAGIIYGMQKEFQATTLEFGEAARGEVSFTVKPAAHNFVLHYKYGSDDNAMAAALVESNKQEPQ